MSLNILGLFYCELFIETRLYRHDYVKIHHNVLTTSHTDHDGTKPILRRLNTALENNNLLCGIIFIISLVFINFAVFINYMPNRVDLPVFWHAMFITFNKLLFVIGLGNIVHLTFLGKLTIIKNILSLELFSAISKVTYGIYLLHIVYILAFFISFPSAYYLNLSDFFLLAVGFFGISIVTSFICSLLLESPVVNILKDVMQTEAPIVNEVDSLKLKG